MNNQRKEIENGRSEIRDFLVHLYDEDVFELCALQVKQKSNRPGYTGGKGVGVGGYFLDKDKATEAAMELDKAGGTGVYVTLNPCNQALLARLDHRLAVMGERTKDADIDVIRWLFVDIDPERPSGVSSSDEEHHAALSLGERIKGELEKDGWPELFFGDSGNGAHLLARLPDSANTPENVGLVKTILKYLEERFKTPGLGIDQKVYNPSRLVKCYGTTARKGDNISSRPHRLARILHLPREKQVLDLDLLRTLGRTVPHSDSALPKSVSSQRTNGATFDVEAYLKGAGVTIKEIKPHGDTQLFVLEECLFDPSHNGGQASIVQTKNGMLLYQCFHDSCKDKRWSDARALLGGKDPVMRKPARHLAPAEQKGYSAADLEKQHFPPIRFVVPDLLPEGITILGGNPKAGKSWMALNYAIAVASGGMVFGKIRVDRGKVLYLALEDGPRRMKTRLRSCCPTGGFPEGLIIHNEWPRMEQGGVEAIDEWLSERPDARLVIIDTLAKVWSAGKSSGKDAGRTIYHEDYDFISRIKAIADKHHVAILGIHHLKKDKMNIDDPLELLSGSMGIAGCADTIHILRRTRAQLNGSLLVVGRDLEKEVNLTLRFDPQIATWFQTEETTDPALTEERRKILEAFENPGQQYSPAEIAKHTGYRDVNVRQLLGKLVEEGNLTKTSYGKYQKVVESEHHKNTDHTGHTGHSPGATCVPSHGGSSGYVSSPGGTSEYDHTDHTGHSPGATCVPSHGGSSGYDHTDHSPESSWDPSLYDHCDLSPGDTPQYDHSEHSPGGGSVHGQCDQSSPPITLPSSDNQLISNDNAGSVIGVIGTPASGHVGGISNDATLQEMRERVARICSVDLPNP